MGRATPPKYRLHKPSGQAFVEIRYKRYYLGKHGTPESREAYRRKLAELWSQESAEVHPDTLIRELVGAFWAHVKQRYVKDGEPTSERAQFKRALKPLKDLYQSTLAAKFSPMCLVAVRQTYIAAGHCRKTINVHTGRVVRCFKWGVSREMVPVTVWQALLSVESLRKGEAPEHPPVKPIEESRVDALEAHVTPRLWAMIQFQRFTGCRPQEVCILRTCDIDRSGDVWIYRPESHKTEHHGKHRVILVGPRAREVLEPWLRENPEEYLFRPCESRTEWLENASQSGEPSKRRSKTRPPRDRYSSGSYHNAIRAGCELAFKMPKHLRYIPAKAADRKERLLAAVAWRAEHCWSPNQLRHTAATKIRAAYGIEAARIILGHSSVATSELYAEKDLVSAKLIMGELG